MTETGALQVLSRTLRAAALAAVFAGLLLPASGGAADAAKRYALSHSGFLQLKVPAGWREEVDAQTQPPVISFRPDAGPPFIVSVIPAQFPAGKRVPSRRELRVEVEEMAAGIRPFAVESEIKLKEISGAGGPGFQFFATDAAPGPGGYKYMTRGKLVAGDVAMTFTILTNDGQEAVIRNAIAMVKGASRVPR